MHPEKQDKLRAELADFAHKDPTYEQLTNGLPYLDAVAREVIRLHPAVQRTQRVVGPLHLLYKRLKAPAILHSGGSRRRHPSQYTYHDCIR